MKRRIAGCVMLMALAAALSGCGDSGHKDSKKKDEQTKQTLIEEAETPQETVTTAEPETEETVPKEERPDYVLDGLKVYAALDFVNGTGWIKTNDKIAAVTSDGKELFSLRGAGVVYASPFVSGEAFVAYKNNNGGFFEEIYNIKGECLYSTTTNDTATGLLEEHIVAQGEGEFLVMRHQADMRADQWVVGSIDGHGNTICEFRPYDYDIGSKNMYPLKELSLPEWMNNAYTARYRLPMTGQFYSYNNIKGEDGQLPWYLGDGIYYLPGQSLLIRPKDGKIICMGSGHGKALGYAGNGKVLFYHGGIGQYGVADMNTQNCQYLENIESTGVIPVTLPPHHLEDGIFFSGHSYYDIDGKEVLRLTDFEGLSIYCTEFYGEYAMAVIEGADQHCYVTVIDRNGRQQFEPFKTERVSADMSNGCFASYADKKWGIYDHNGNFIKAESEGDYCVFSEDIVRFVTSTDHKLYSLTRLGVTGDKSSTVTDDGSQTAAGAGLSAGQDGKAGLSMLRVDNGIFYIREEILGKTYEEVNQLFGGKLPALQVWEWGMGYDHYFDYTAEGEKYAFFFKDNRLSGIRYEVVSKDLGTDRIEAYTKAFGTSAGIKREDGTEIPFGENGSGYHFTTKNGYLEVFFNEYDGAMHVAMHYGL